MTVQIPTYTLPLCAFAGFRPETRDALEVLFSAPPEAEGCRLRALGVAMTNGTRQCELILDAESSETLKTLAPFKVPSAILKACAAAGFLVSNDPGLDGLRASMSINCGPTQHTRFAITPWGCLSWIPQRMPLATTKNSGQYQAALYAGEVMLAFVDRATPGSAHAHLHATQTLLPLAADIYATDLASRRGRDRIGASRKVSFRPETTIRSPHMARRS